MKRTLAALAAVLLMAPAAQAQPTERSGTVTRAEYNRVERGMTRARVEHIFGAGRGCVYARYESGYIGVQYRQGNGNYTAINYKRESGVWVHRGVREFNTSLGC